MMEEVGDTHISAFKELYKKTVVGHAISFVLRQKGEREREEEVGMFWLTHLSNTLRRKNATSAETNSIFKPGKPLLKYGWADSDPERGTETRDSTRSNSIIMPNIDLYIFTLMSDSCCVPSGLPF